MLVQRCMFPSEKRLVYGLCRFGTSLTLVCLDSLLSLRVNLTLLKPSPPTWVASLSFLLVNFPRNPGVKLLNAEDSLQDRTIPAPRAGHKEMWNDWWTLAGAYYLREVWAKVHQIPFYSVWCPWWSGFLPASWWSSELGLSTYSSLSMYSDILPLFMEIKPSMCHCVIMGSLSHAP